MKAMQSKASLWRSQQKIAMAITKRKSFLATYYQQQPAPGESSNCEKTATNKHMAATGSQRKQLYQPAEAK